SRPFGHQQSTPQPSTSPYGTPWDGIWDVLRCKKTNVYSPWDGGTAWRGGGWVPGRPQHFVGSLCPPLCRSRYFRPAIGSTPSSPRLRRLSEAIPSHLELSEVSVFFPLCRHPLSISVPLFLKPSRTISTYLELTRVCFFLLIPIWEFVSDFGF